MLFLPEEILQTDDQGNYIVPREKDQQLFMAKQNDGGLSGTGQGIDEYNPALRVQDNRLAIDTALAMLGKRCGLGFNYYSLERDSGSPKTAKEVASGNADLIRNARKHQRAIGGQIARLCECVLCLASKFSGEVFSDTQLEVLFGDTVCEDEDTLRERDRADVSAGLLPKWVYIMRYQGVDEQTARSWADSGAGSPSPLEA